MNKIFYAAGDV